jgi:hypothetical protein
MKCLRPASDVAVLWRILILRNVSKELADFVGDNFAIVRLILTFV